jgi:hypothetical protein
MDESKKQKIMTNYGIDYIHEENPENNNKFTRSDNEKCFIEYFIRKETSPYSIYIHSFVCSTNLAGSGRVLMMELFYFLKKKYKPFIDDDTYVFLNPNSYMSVENLRISKEKRNPKKLVDYYESLKFNQNNKYPHLWGGKIGDILKGIFDYRKEGGKGKKSRKCKKGKKSRSYKRK